MINSYNSAVASLVIEDNGYISFTPYDTPVYVSSAPNAWRYFENIYERRWIYDFTEKPTIQQVFEVLSEKLKCLEWEKL